MPFRLAPGDLGDPGWGDFWFPHGAFVASLTFWYGLVILMFFPLFLLPYHVEMIQCCHLLHELAHELAPVTPRFGGFVLCCCVLFLVGGFVFLFWCLAFLMVLRDGLLDCTQVLYQFTLEAPQSADGHVYALIN